MYRKAYYFTYMVCGLDVGCIKLTSCNSLSQLGIYCICGATAMLVSTIVLLFIFIQDVTGIENPISDNEDYTGASSGSGQSTLMNNCDNAYTNYSDCFFIMNQLILLVMA